MKIKFTKIMLDILKSKIEYQPEERQMCGNFTYAEIVILVDHFGVKERSRGWKYQYSVDNLKCGMNGTTWFYFDWHKSFNRMSSHNTKTIIYKQGHVKCLS